MRKRSRRATIEAMPERRPIALLTLAAVAALVVALPAAAAGAKLKQPAEVHVKKAGTKSVIVAWKDRSSGERRYEVRLEAPDDTVAVRGVRANRESGQVKGLEPGTRYGVSVEACGKGAKCGPAGSAQAATLLAAFNGPHPSPGCEVFPGADAFNTPVAGLPKATRSDQIVANLGGDLHPDFGSNPSYGIPYVVVPPFQPEAKIRFTAYGDESDPGPYPIPPGAPIEGGRNSDGDRHVLVVERPASPGDDCTLYELYRSFEKGGVKNLWTGDSGAVFDLGSPLLGQRPAGWTSADAAGLPIFPGLVTREEVASGEIDHAIRITFDETRRAYIEPATHHASDSCEPARAGDGRALPPQGRLRASRG